MANGIGNDAKGAAIAAPAAFVSEHFLKVGGLALALALMLGLGACREEEQGRPLYYDKGTYGGQQDSGISEATFQELKQRALEQKGP
jgi:hypothetical protein